MTNTDPIAAHDAAVERLNELQAEAAALARRASEIEGRIRAEDRADRTTEAAEALLDGSAVEGAQDSRQELADTRTRLRVTRRAIELQRGRVNAARRERDEAIIASHEPGIRKAAQKLAETLVAMGDAADELHAALAALDAQGVHRLAGFPGLRLDPLRSSLEVSRANGLLDELESGYAVRVDRAALGAARKRRAAAHAAEVERAKDAGALIAAGPKGVVEYDVGGKPKKPPIRGTRSGRDDYKDGAAWGIA